MNIGGIILALILFQDAAMIPPILNDQIISFTYRGEVTGASPQATYQWIPIIRPLNSQIVFSSPNTPTTDVTLAGHGTYVLRLVVRDGVIPVAFADEAFTTSPNFLPYQNNSPITVKIVQTSPIPDVRDTSRPVITSIRFGNAVNPAIIPPGGTGIISSTATTATLTITATDNLGVKFAIMFVDSHIVDQKSVTIDKLNQTFTLQWSENPIPIGTHSVTIRVFDSSGNSQDQSLFLKK